MFWLASNQALHGTCCARFARAGPSGTPVSLSLGSGPVMKSCVVLLFAAVLLSCLYRSVDDTVVSATPVQLGERPIEIPCDPPLVRSRRSASVRLELVEPWSTQPPGDHIVVDGIGEVRLNITLVTADGRQYRQAILGRAGGLDARFDPQLPLDERVVTLRVQSSVPLHATRITWHNFDPL